MKNQQYLYVAGRILLSFPFIASGLNKVFDWSGSVQYMAAQGMPLIPLFLSAAIVVELAGGFSLVFGWFDRWGAALLFLFLIPTTLIFHNFWAYTGTEQQMQMVNFLKNLAIMGGLLLVTADDHRASEHVGRIEEPQDRKRPRPKLAAGQRR